VGKKVIIPLHGIRTHAEWQRAFVDWFIQNGKALVSSAAQKVNSNATHVVFSEDEVGQMLRSWLMVSPQWGALLQSKPYLPMSEYGIITDAMARYIACDAYVAIIGDS
jgi:hypothetical protein